jgi:hypothetical protein
VTRRVAGLQMPSEERALLLQADRRFETGDSQLDRLHFETGTWGWLSASDHGT